MGVCVFVVLDGDVVVLILICMFDSEVDMMYCIGGVLEGVVFVVVICVLDGDM